MRSTADYLAKIPPLNAGKPNFQATIAAIVSSFADNQVFLNDLSQVFDLDVAVGVQLDAVGAWAGISRIIPIPVTKPWFSWGVPQKGWLQAYWKGPTILGDNYQSLDDDTYRRLIHAKIAANYSDGFVADAQAALATYYLDPTLIFTVDNTVAIGWVPGLTNVPGQPDAGMSWQVGVAGQLPTLVDLEILAQNLIPIGPLGVTLDVKVTTVNGTPLFGWGIENEYISGWGVGAYGASPEYVVENVL